MFIKYHLIYYGISCLLVIISLLVHPIFWLFLFVYGIFVIYRLKLHNFIAWLGEQSAELPYEVVNASAENVLKYIDDKFKNHQVILLTCTNREKDILDKNLISYNNCEL